MKRLLLLIVVLTLPPTIAKAWDNFVSHERLSLKAMLAIADDETTLDALAENLGLREGLEQDLGLQLGFDPMGVDLDIQPTTLESQAPDPQNCNPIQRSWQGSRLTDNLNKTSDEPDPIDGALFPSPEIGVVLNPRCPDGEDHAACVEALCRFSAQTWIELGTFAEDNPNGRAQHHFHDPVKQHVIPGNHGLDNQDPVLLGLDALVADGLTAALRGGSWTQFLEGLAQKLGWRSEERDLGNFDLQGLSAVDRALNTPRDGVPASDEGPRNLFALPDAERYLYRAVTAPYADERDSFTTLYFLSLGHVLHLLQDMGSVAHTRNDFKWDHVVVPKLLRLVSLEDAPRQQVGGTLVADSVLASLMGDASIPYAKLQQYAATPAGQGLDLASFDPSLGLESLDALRRREVGALFDEDPFTSPNGGGLAEYVNTHFFSAGSIEDETSADGYALPLIPGCGDVGDSVGSGDERVSVAELPARSLATGEFTGESDVYYSSRAVPHLARCRFHSRTFVNSLPKALWPWMATVVDETVQRDYLELIWPRVIQMTAAFLTSQLSPRLEVIPESEASFRLANASLLPLQFDPSAVELAYDTLDQQTELLRRVVVPIHCDSESNEEVLAAAPKSGEVGPASAFLCHIPESLDEPAAIRDSFSILVRGALGQRGQTGTRAEFDSRNKDFVVAMRRIRPAAVIDRVTPGTDDASEQVDLLRMSVDPEEGFALGAPENLTARLRTAIGSQIDVSFPTAIPGTGLLAVRSDETVPADQDEPLFRTGTQTDLYLFDRIAATDPSKTGYLGPAPDSRYDHLSFASAQATATPSGTLIFAPAGISGQRGLRAYVRDPNQPFSGTSSRPVTSRGAIAILDTPSADVVEMERCGEPKRLVPISETEALVTAECTRATWDLVSQSQVQFGRSADSVFLATLVDQGAEIEAVYTDVLDAQSAGAARGLVACAADISDPLFPSSQRPACPPSAGAIQRVGGAHIDSVLVVGTPTRRVRVSFLHNLNPQYNSVPGPTSDLLYLESLEGQGDEVYDVALGLPNTMRAESAWSPDGSVIAFLDSATQRLSFVDVSDPMAPGEPVTPLLVGPPPRPGSSPDPPPLVAASFSWDAGLLLP